MPDRRASWLAAEVLFLVALAVGLALADQPPLVIGGLMLLGWVLVALLEWATSRDEPHYGSGLPPRYYVPQVSLPPRQPLEQVGGYPAAESRDEAPTWIASPALRSEVLGEWPVAPPPPGEETQEDPPADDAADVEEEKPAAEPAVAELDEAAVAEAAPAPVRTRRRLWGRRDESEGAVDPWTVEELPVEPEGEASVNGEPAERAPLPVVELPVTTQRTARHRLDPLSEPEQKRRLWRRHHDTNGIPTIEVPARPEGVRILPGRGRSED